jgi:hypothetical protein
VKRHVIYIGHLCGIVRKKPVGIIGQSLGIGGVKIGRQETVPEVFHLLRCKVEKGL